MTAVHRFDAAMPFPAISIRSLVSRERAPASSLWDRRRRQAQQRPIARKRLRSAPGANSPSLFPARLHAATVPNLNWGR